MRQVLDIASVQREAAVQRLRMLDEVGREAMAGTGDGHASSQTLHPLKAALPAQAEDHLTESFYVVGNDSNRRRSIARLNDVIWAVRPAKRRRCGRRRR